MALKDKTLAKTEDCRGQKCPYPNLMAKKGMKAAEEGVYSRASVSS